MPDFAQRRQKLRRALKKEGVEGLLVTNFVNVTYLTGFTGDDSYLLLHAEGESLISDMRYTTQLEEECPGLELSIREPGTKIHEAAASLVESVGLRRLGLEGDSVTLSQQEQLQAGMPQVEFQVTSGLVEELRITKDRDEIAQIRHAGLLAKRVFESVVSSMTPEMTEKRIAADLEYQARLFGGAGLSFPPIVAVGARAALPHAPPTDCRLSEAAFVLIDWGVQSGLYLSDLTRVLATNKISKKLQKIYDIVLEAQQAAIAAIAPGKTCEEIDSVARKIITKAGYGKEFGHGLGHGVGLEIHEAPRLGQKEETILEPGMVVTVEPGIYMPDWGGVRIEDDILVTKSGYEKLTDVDLELRQIEITV